MYGQYGGLQVPLYESARSSSTLLIQHFMTLYTTSTRNLINVNMRLVYCHFLRCECQPPEQHLTLLSENLQNTASSELHKLRRRAFEPLFSRAKVLKLESLVREGVENMCNCLQEARTSEQPANMSLLYRSLTADVMRIRFRRFVRLSQQAARIVVFLRRFCQRRPRYVHFSRSSLGKPIVTDAQQESCLGSTQR
jgi:hypothetical protein